MNNHSIDKEISYYQEICQKFIKYLMPTLPEGSKIEYSFNKNLGQQIKDISDKLHESPNFDTLRASTLKIDILLGIKIPNKSTKYILFEVKYSNQLTLNDYSQLIGYLQVAKNLNIGILFLVFKDEPLNALSKDFSQLLNLNNIALEWEIKEPNNDINSFKVGICKYMPGNGIEWVNTDINKGIKNFDELKKLLDK